MDCHAVTKHGSGMFGSEMNGRNFGLSPELSTIYAISLQKDMVWLRAIMKKRLIISIGHEQNLYASNTLTQ
jgi:hypothetical protein